MKLITALALGVAFLVAGSSFAKDAPKGNPFNSILVAVPAAELPAKAADLVAQAKSDDRQATTTNVVKAAVGINPAAAPAIVGAIARALPDMAAVAAGVAAAEQPRQASAIARAAAAAAPAQAGEVVTAVCRSVPKEYRNVAAAVSQVAPGAGKAIVNGVATAVPELKPYLEKVVAGYGGNVPSVTYTLDQAVGLSRGGTEAAPLASTPGSPSTTRTLPGGRGPGIGPPYIPLTTTPTNVSPGGSGQVPDGGRNYASP